MMPIRSFSLAILGSIVTLSAAHMLAQNLPLKPNSGVRGTVESISKEAISISSEFGPVKANLGPGVTFYKRVPSSLAKVTPKSFIGVTTVKQPDGSEKATEIHLFPDSLRGAGEGSRMMGQPTSGASQSRMTNGTISSSKMTNGMVSGSRMTNGTVQKTAGSSSMVVDYGDGAQPVIIPPDVKVTEIVPTTDRPSKGDVVSFVPVKKQNGGYTTSKITLSTSVPAK